MKIAVFGANGRVGSAVCRLARKKGFEVLEIEKDTEISTLPKADVAIDFSLPQATETVVCYCNHHRCPLVSGVTGRNDYQQMQIDRLKDCVAVVESSNFSIGIGLLKQLCKQASQLGWDCEIVETHRKGKRDSPSGTAKDIATAILQNGTRTVQIHALRCGSNFGTHQIVFATDGESITLTHHAENVEIFARGALLEAEKLLRNITN